LNVIYGDEVGDGMWRRFNGRINNNLNLNKNKNNNLKLTNK
jgi:hypothetical protein